MNNLSTHCPRCRFSLEIRPDFENVICRSCGTAYWVRQYGGSLNLSEIGSEGEAPEATGSGVIIEKRLADIDELIAEVESEIEIGRSREQSTPLQLGCAFFGLFMAIVAVSSLFMLLGKGYFGSWIFYASIAAVIGVGIARIRRKLIGPIQRQNLRQDRLQAEEKLTELETERNRLEELKRRLRFD